jgi:hypothetical protein
MQIDNQKNGTRGGTIHHNALHSRWCPIRALAQHVHHILSHQKGNQDDILSTYFSTKEDAQVLKTTHITMGVHFRAKDITFWDLNLCVIPNDASLKQLYIIQQ